MLGSALLLQGKDGFLALTKAAALSPNDAETFNSLGVAQRAAGELDASLVSLRHALKLSPNYAQAHNNLGNTPKELERYDEALASFSQAIALKPSLYEVYKNQGLVLFDQGRLDEALASFRLGIEVNPYDSTGFLFAINNEDTLTAADILNEHRQFGQSVESLLRVNWPAYTNDKTPGRRLQVAFVSGDLKNHAVASFIEPVLAHLAKSEHFELHAY